jgi:hypothetical protein
MYINVDTIMRFVTRAKRTSNRLGRRDTIKKYEYSEIKEVGVSQDWCGKCNGVHFGIFHIPGRYITIARCKDCKTSYIVHDG